MSSESRFIRAKISVGRKKQGAQYHYNELLEIKDGECAFDVIDRWRKRLIWVEFEEVDHEADVLYNK